MRFVDVVQTSELVAATSSRSAKRDLLAALLARCDAGTDEVVVVVGFLVGEPRQGRIGVGWRTLAQVGVAPAAEPSLSAQQVDDALDRLTALGGPGSGTARRELLAELLGRATAAERSFLERLLGGELRQGASSGVMVDAVAGACGVPVAVVRRALMLGGRLDQVAQVARRGGRDALERIGLQVGRPLQPMLASTAASAAEAVEQLGMASVEWKLDGIRIQVHRDGDEVRIWTRNLNEITDRLPAVVAAARQLDLRTAVLDGEAISFGADGRPRLFQDTVSVDAAQGADGGLRPYFFDLLHCDGVDLVDRPLEQRRALLQRVGGDWVIPSELTADVGRAEKVLGQALAAGHEGVVVKGASSTYDAGRRGKAWRKVKPVHTLDLVVIGAEWGHGRRTGWLSNLHLAARAADGDGFVMVGKTFKGLTDELLGWQTARFCELAGLDVPARGAGHPAGHPADPAPVGEVALPPVQVVEIALDGVQRSTRYPGGVALRFARVLRYRDDKDAAQADSIEAVRSMLAG